MRTKNIFHVFSFLILVNLISAKGSIYSHVNVEPVSSNISSEFARKRTKAHYQYFKTMITSFPSKAKVSFFYQYVNPEVNMPQNSAASLFKRIMDLGGLDKTAAEMQASEKLNKFLSTNFKTVYLPGNVYTSYNNHLPKPFYRKELEAWVFDAVDNGNEEAVRGLLDNFNLLGSADEGGNNLLSNAIINNQNNIARMLIYRGISLDSTNNDGITPLMLAAQSSNAELVSLLLLNGASPYYKDKNGSTAYKYALMSDDEELVNLIKKNMLKHKKRKLRFKKKNSL